MRPRPARRRRPGPLLAILLACGVVTIARADRAALLAGVADAERAFARAASERGVRAAFLEFLDDDAIRLDPTPGSAKDAWRARPVPPDPLATKLLWEPRTGDVSSAGDLAWLTGPFTLVPGGDAARTAHGCYFSVWRRPDASRPWRVLLDEGITTPGPCAFPDGFVPFAAGGNAVPDAPGATPLEADRAIAAGGPPALAAVLHDRVRLHRQGRQPVTGAEAARADLAKGTARFTTLDGGASRSGDLGYTYGRVERDSKTGHYLRVWRRGASGAWRVVADVETEGR